MSKTICRICMKEIDDTGFKRGEGIIHCHSSHVVGNKETIIKERKYKAMKGGNNEMAVSEITQAKKTLADEVIKYLENKGCVDTEKRKVFSTAYSAITRKIKDGSK